MVDPRDEAKMTLRGLSKNASDKNTFSVDRNLGSVRMTQGKYGIVFRPTWTSCWTLKSEPRGGFTLDTDSYQVLSGESNPNHEVAENFKQLSEISDLGQWSGLTVVDKGGTTTIQVPFPGELPGILEKLGMGKDALLVAKIFVEANTAEPPATTRLRRTLEERDNKIKVLCAQVAELSAQISALVAQIEITEQRVISMLPAAEAPPPYKC